MSAFRPTRKKTDTKELAALDSCFRIETTLSGDRKHCTECRTTFAMTSSNYNLRYHMHSAHSSLAISRGNAVEANAGPSAAAEQDVGPTEEELEAKWDEQAEVLEQPDEHGPEESEKSDDVEEPEEVTATSDDAFVAWYLTQEIITQGYKFTGPREAKLLAALLKKKVRTHVRDMKEKIRRHVAYKPPSESIAA
jgi:hypothetical protein